MDTVQSHFEAFWRDMMLWLSGVMAGIGLFEPMGYARADDMLSGVV